MPPRDAVARQPEHGSNGVALLWAWSPAAEHDRHDTLLVQARAFRKLRGIDSVFQAQLIDAAGCRGMQRGGARISPMHCNFLINTGTASAADIEALGEEARRRVMDKFGVELRWEIRRIGVPADGGAR